jgi:hypothetical protein
MHLAVRRNETARGRVTDRWCWTCSLPFRPSGRDFKASRLSWAARGLSRRVSDLLTTASAKLFGRVQKRQTPGPAEGFPPFSFSGPGL